MVSGGMSFTGSEKQQGLGTTHLHGHAAQHLAAQVLVAATGKGSKQIEIKVAEASARDVEKAAAGASQAPGGTSLAIPVVAATNIHDGLQHIAAGSFQGERSTSVSKLVQSAQLTAPGCVLNGRQPRRRQRRAAAARQQNTSCAQAGSPARCSSCPGLRLAIGTQLCRRLHGNTPCRWRRSGGGGRRQVRPPPLHRPLRLGQAAPSGDLDACAGRCLDHRGDRWGQQQGPKGLCGAGARGASTLRGSQLASFCRRDAGAIAREGTRASPCDRAAPRPPVIVFAESFQRLRRHRSRLSGRAVPEQAREGFCGARPNACPALCPA